MQSLVVHSDEHVHQTACVEPTPVPTFNLEIFQFDPEDSQEPEWEAFDDLHKDANRNPVALPLELVRAARKKEIHFFKDRKVYSLSTTAEAF